MSNSKNRGARFAPSSAAYTATNPVVVSRGPDGGKQVSYPGLKNNLMTQGNQVNIFKNPQEIKVNPRRHKTLRKLKNRLEMHLQSLMAKQKLVKHPDDLLMPAHMVNQFVGSFNIPLEAYIVDGAGNIGTLVDALDDLHKELGVNFSVKTKAGEYGLDLAKANLSVLPINKLGIQLQQNGRNVSLGNAVLVNFFPEDGKVKPNQAEPKFQGISYDGMGSNILDRPKYVPLQDIVAYLGMTGELDTGSLAGLEGQDLFAQQLALVQRMDLQQVIQAMNGSQTRKFENLRKYARVGESEVDNLIEASLGDLDHIFNREFKIVSPLEWGLMAELQDGANYDTFGKFLSDPGRLSYEVHPHALTFIGSKKGRRRLAEALSTTRVPFTLYAGSSVDDLGGYLRLWSLFVPSAGRGYIGGEANQDYISLYTQLSMLRQASGLTGMGLDFDMYKTADGKDMSPQYLISRLERALPWDLVNREEDTVNFMNRRSNYKYYLKGDSDHELSAAELNRIHPSQVTCGPANKHKNQYWDYRAKLHLDDGKRWSCEPNKGANLQRSFARTNTNAGRQRQLDLANAGYTANMGRALSRGGITRTINPTTGQLVIKNMQDQHLKRIQAAQEALEEDGEQVKLQEIANKFGVNYDTFVNQAFESQNGMPRRRAEDINIPANKQWNFNRTGRAGGAGGSVPVANA